MINLKEGEKAPDFELTETNGNKVRLSDFKGKNVILYFYPKDDTPGCTIQAKQFTENKDKLKKLNAVVLGVSLDDESSHKKFCDKFDINFTLLCDIDASVSKKYGVYEMQNFPDFKGMGITRSTFIINEKGNIKKIFYKVNPEKSIDDIMYAFN